MDPFDVGNFSNFPFAVFFRADQTRDAAKLETAIREIDVPIRGRCRRAGESARFWITRYRGGGEGEGEGEGQFPVLA